MKFISLFSGIGGFDLGFERAGMQCAAQVEIDKHCLTLLADKFPQAERFTDVKEFHYGEPIDLICGGFPCQDVSVAGRRAGLAGERSGLWHEFHRVIAESRPGWVIIENVPGLLSSNEGRDFAVILRGLVECGYGVCWRILDAQYFGIPQRRRRVFIVGSLGNGRAAEVLFEREGVPGNPPPRRQTGQDASRVAGTLAANGGGTDRPAGNANELDFCIPDVSGTLSATSGDSKTQQFNELDFLIARSLTSRNERQDFETENLITYNWQSGGDVRHDFNERPMLQSSQVPAIGIRRLTPHECERLQGFPNDWTAGFSDSVRYRMLGNAVAVPVAEWIARRIAAARVPLFV